MSTNLIFVISGVVAFILLVTVVLILTRYKKCKSDELLIVYGRTSKKKLRSAKDGEKVEIDSSNCKCIQGGAKFIIPVIQGYSILKMTPKQIVCNLTNALDLQKIETSVKTVITVAISKNPAVQINAATRLLGLDDRATSSLISEICFGSLRLVVSEMLLEDLVNSRDKFLELCKTRIGSELEKIGFDLININISEISDNAHYLENLGKSAEARATFTAKSEIEKRTKEGEIAIATQKQEKEVKLSEISRDKEIQVSENKKQQDIRTAEIERDRVTTTETTKKEQEVSLRDIEREKRVQIAEKAKDEAVSIREVEKNQTLETATLEKEEAEKKSEIERDKQIAIATNQSNQAQKVAEQERLKESEVAAQNAQAKTAVATANAKRDSDIAAKESESQALQAKSRNDAAASVVESEQDALARKEVAKRNSEAKQVEAEREKESKLAEYASQTRQRTADAEKAAKLSENNNGIAIVKSNAQLGKETAESEKQIGLAKIESDKAVRLAEQEKEQEVFKAKQAAEKERLEAEKIVDADVERRRKEIEAEGIKKQMILNAEGEAEKIRQQALAEADSIRAKLKAEAEGKLELAKVEQVLKAAETENIANLAKSGVSDVAQVSYILKEEYKLIAAEDAKKFEHINTGNVTVVGGESTVGKYLLNTVEAISKVSSLRGLVPGLDGVLGKLENFDRKNQLKPTEEPEQPQEETPEEK